MATSASGIYNETLQGIVNAKLVELERKRSVFEASKTKLLSAVDKQPTDTARLRCLVDGVKNIFGIRSSQDGRVVMLSSKHRKLEEKLSNLERFLTQPQYDPSVSRNLLMEWEKDLVQQLAVQSSRYEYAALYAKLVTEWLVAEKKIGVAQDDSGDMAMSGFEELESRQKLEAREEWAKSVFEPMDRDTAAITKYLRQLFGEDREDKMKPKALKVLRKDVAEFERQLAQPGQFNEYNLRWVIGGLLTSDLLTEDKRNVLRDFLPNSIILNEIADVLNLRMSALQTWTWGERVELEQKRKIQGHFEIVMHEDLLQAIFLQYIGIKWSVFLKGTLKKFIEMEGAWAPPHAKIPLEDKLRREYFLGGDVDDEEDDTLAYARKAVWRSSFFVAQLQGNEEEVTDQAEGEEEASFSTEMLPTQQRPAAQAPGAMVKQMARKAVVGQSAASYSRAGAGMGGAKRHRRVMNDNEVETNECKRFITRPTNRTQAKQTLLHLLSTEIQINKPLYGGLTAFRAQFESWNPFLPHSTALTVMKFFGVSDKWNDFFTKFLQAPLAFDEEEEVRLRRRGTPGSHAISDVLGEAVLFCMDLAVNQATNGQRLWRVHDDFWFWSTDPSDAGVAWDTIVDFSSLMGLTLDTKKAGSATVGVQQAHHEKLSLPAGQIRWGFLFLNPNTGAFEIDQAQVDRHVSDLQKQLDSKTASVFSWIEVWNAYADVFLSTNFGKPVNCFGQGHIDNVLATLERVQRKIFEGKSRANSVVDFLKSTLTARFGIEDISEGYVFFPSALGGLELRNPFIVPLQLRDFVVKQPEKMVQMYIDHEKEQYRLDKISFEEGRVDRSAMRDQNYKPADAHRFMSFDEYVRYREQTNLAERNNKWLVDIFQLLMKQPQEQESVMASSEITTALSLMDRTGVVGQPGKCGINGDWNTMQPYWKWMLGLHGPEVLQRFGGLNIVDNGVLPIGMVSLFRSQGISWSG
jgi:hypothetical protein